MKGLPYMSYAANKSTQQIIQFSGVRYGRGGRDGELAESMNLSARQFPALSQRTIREKHSTYDKATAIFGKGKLCVIDGTKFLYGGEQKGTVTEGEKQIVSVNTKIVIWPDMVYFDTKEEKFGTLGATATINGNSATFTTSSLKGSPTGGNKLSDLFSKNQAVKISGSSIQENNKEIVIRDAKDNELIFYEDSFKAGTSTTQITIERRVPELKVICSSNNRLWGADDATIWASALGDPLTWYNYDGLSTDSYAVAVGSDGPFTMCCEYGSNVLFFKEDKLHKVLGSSPREYSIYTYSIPGVQIGSMKSAQVINEVLYYKGVEGVYAYNGGLPYLISDNFGTRLYDSARAGTDGRIYYISMRDTTSGEWSMFTFDTERNMWLREDTTHALDFAALDGELLLLESAGKEVYKSSQKDTGDKIKWMAEFYPMDEVTHGKKGYSRLFLRYELEPGAWMQVEIKEDLSPYRKIGIFHGQRLRTSCLTMIPGRCDSFQIRLSGEGRCVLKSLVREFDVGSEN